MDQPNWKTFSKLLGRVSIFYKSEKLQERATELYYLQLVPQRELSNILEISNDSIPNFSITVLFLALTEVQVKAFDSLTTSRSLIMKNDSNQAVSLIAVGSASMSPC